MLEHFKDVQKMQEVLRQAQTGLWAIELDEGKAPRMYADSSMLELLGFDKEPLPEECYRVWYDRIEDKYYPVVQDAVERLTADERAEVQYSWEHPKWGKIFVRCGGVRDSSYSPGVCLRGYHQNISDTIMLKQEYDSIIRTLNNECMVILRCNLTNKQYKIIKRLDGYNDCFLGGADYEADLRKCIEHEAAPQYSRNVLDILEPEFIHQKLQDGERELERIFRCRNGGWRRLRVLPTGDYPDTAPWVIIAIDEQDAQIEQRLSERSAKIAISQLYKLVVSVNLSEGLYNCIHYSGKILDLGHHGQFKDFYRQMSDKMIEKDRGLFEQVFLLETYKDNRYLEGALHLLDESNHLHFYSFYAVYLRQDMENHIILTIRNVDDKQMAERKAEVLTKLCNSYYSVYAFDLEHDIEEAIWQEDQIRQKEFPKGSLHHYYDKFVREYVYPEDQEKMRRAGTAEFLQNTLTPEQPVLDIDFRRVYPDGIQWVRSRFSIEEMRDGVVTKVVFANMNIHEQKLAELEQEEQNRKALLAAYETAKKANEAKSNFLAQMSHDIRTPMNAIIGMTSIASKHLDNPQKIADCLTKITSSSNHLLKLINEILDMSKIEKGKLELKAKPFYLDRLMKELYEIIRLEADSKQQTISFQTDGIIHNKLLGDELRIKQVLLNLSNNAVKYTSVGGHIDIAVHEVSAKSADKGCFVFTVQDNGIGMPEDYLDYIFVPFSRAEDARRSQIQGTGLGMSIAQGIVEAMQGNIQVESEKGRGSRFTITVNLQIAEDETYVMPEDISHLNQRSDKDCVRRASEDGNGEMQTDCNAQGIRLLLVEDNALNLEIARTLLMDFGFEVDSARDGLEALKTFTDSSPDTYQAILMDLQMPVMDGYTSAREIRRSSHVQALKIPIIALTANAFAQDITKALASGMDDHVSKPIDYQHLVDTIMKVIQKKNESN